MKKTIAMLFVAMIALSLMPGALAASQRFPNLVVTLVNQEPDPVAPGNAFDVRFRIENDEASPANNVKVKLVMAYPFSVYGDDINEKNIGTVASSQAEDLGVVEKWKLYVDPNAATGDQKIEFWYKIDQGAWTRAGEYQISIRSANPFLAINEVKTNPEKIVPGTPTKVSFVLENHADNDLRDITLNLHVYTATVTTTGIVTNELPFTPIGSGNEKTISRIAKGQSSQLTFDLFTDAEAQSKVYKVPFTLTYSDSSGTNYTRTGVLGLLVDSEPELSVYVEDSDIQAAGSSGRVVVKLVNKGFSDIKFLNVKMQESADFDLLSTSEFYVGKLDSDDYETADFDIHVPSGAKDKVMLPLVVEYRDANGKLYSRQVEPELRLYSSDELKRKNGGGGGITWVVVVIILAAAGFYLYRRFRKNSKKR